MSGERLLRILALMSTHAGSGEASSLCQVATEITGMSGAGIMVFQGDLPRGSVCTTNPVSALIEDLQYTLGEGPCVDAHNLGRPVAEADLAAPTVSRWPAFVPPAVTGGARAVFGFPVRIGAIRLGALNLYRDRPGGLSDDQHADALAMADVAARSILSLQADAPPGALAAELEAGADFHLVVHQAAGMVSIQLDVGVAEALLRLRARAFATGVTITRLAQDVVERRVRFAGPAGRSIPNDP
jgi:hypothetical protein